MNIDEKKKRLMELIQNGNLSDSEIAEINKLEDDIRNGKTTLSETLESIKQENKIAQKEEQPKKVKKTIIQYLKEKYGTKPATRTEIEQLKLEREKAIIKRDISIAKSQTPSRMDKILKALNTLSEPASNNKRKVPKF